MPGGKVPEKRRLSHTVTVRCHDAVEGTPSAGVSTAADQCRGDCPLNIVLIGMPGAGKSSVGVLLAKRLGYHFVDTDLLIQVEAHARLQLIISRQGLEAFKAIEEQVVCRLSPQRTVIATGGSVVYSAAAMAHLQRLGRVVYLDLPLDELQQRVRDMDSRGLVIDPGESFADLYARRTPLYRRYAGLTVAGRGLSQEQIAALIEAQLCGTGHDPSDI